MKNKKILFLLITISLVTQCVSPAFSKKCRMTNIKPIYERPLSIPVNPGNTNNDPTYKGTYTFVDLDIPENDESVLSTCTSKSSGAKLLKINPLNGNLQLTNTNAVTDPPENPSSIRGLCKFNRSGNQLFFSGNGPQKNGFDRIYPYNLENSELPFFLRTRKDDKDNYFIPSDQATSLVVTPRENYVVYLQGNTSNKNLASIQSVKIDEKKALNKSFVGQAISTTIEAGTFIEFFSKDPEERYAYGIFSNLDQGRNASGTGFGIFRTNQNDGSNLILKEFKKGSLKHSLPAIFNKESFVGFSGFKGVERDGEFFLFISYVEKTTNENFTNDNYLTKLGIFKINPYNTPLEITQVGLPVVTAFKLKPCMMERNYGISGPVWITDDNVFVADNRTVEEVGRGENYIASYHIDWDKISNADGKTLVMRLSSVPQKTSINNIGRNTDILTTRDGRYAYVATSSTEGFNNVNILSYSLFHSDIECQGFMRTLDDSGICPDFIEAPAQVISGKIPDQIVSVKGLKTLDLNKYFMGGESLSYSLSNNNAQSFLSIFENIITLNPSDESLIGEYNDIRVNINDEVSGKTHTSSFNIKVLREYTPPPAPSETAMDVGTKETVTENPSLPPTNLDGLGAPTSDTSTNEENTETASDTSPVPFPVIPSVPDFSNTSPSAPSQANAIAENSNSNNSGLKLPDLSEVKKEKSVKMPTPQNGESASEEKEPVQKKAESKIKEPTLPEVKDIEPAADVKKEEKNKESFTINIKSLNLLGPDQLIIAPKIEKEKIKEVKNVLSKLSFKKEEKLEEKTKEKEIRGAEPGVKGEYLIHLKKDIKLESKDLKNLTFIIIDKNKKATSFSGESKITDKNILSSKLTFPKDLESGEVTLVTLLNKNGKKEVISKGKVSVRTYAEDSKK